jgi:hypothetical protein
MVVKVGKGRIDFLGPKIAMLPQQLLRRPSVLIVFRSQVQNLVARSADTRRSLFV